MTPELRSRIAHYLHESVDYTHDRNGRRTGEDCPVCVREADMIIRIFEYETKTLCCDACGKMKPIEQVHMIRAYGLETWACEECRSEQGK